MSVESSYCAELQRDSKFLLARDLVEMTSRGNIWMIGGAVFRTLVALKYGGAKTQAHDFDFIVEEVLPEYCLPQGWSTSINSFGNRKLKNQVLGLEVDLVPLGNVHSLKSRGIHPDFSRFLEFTPLNIQSIGFHLNTYTLIGEVGLTAIEEKIVRIHHQEEAENYCRLKGISVEDFVRSKAKTLGFEYAV